MAPNKSTRLRGLFQKVGGGEKKRMFNGSEGGGDIGGREGVDEDDGAGG